MLSKILELKEVTKLNKAAKQSINGGYYCRTNVPCQTSQDCWDFSGDFSDRCNQGYCHVF